MKPSLRNSLIRLAFDQPALRPDLLPLIRLARTYDEYVKDFEGKEENKGKKPKGQKEWAARNEDEAKGEERLKGRDIDIKALQKKMPDSFPEGALEDLTAKVAKMDDEEFNDVARKLKALAKSKNPKPGEVADWGKDTFGGSTKSWLEEMDEKDNHDEIGLFGTAMMSFFEKLYEKVRDL